MNKTMPMRLLWLLQLSDTALPIGALNHSFGIETLTVEESLSADTIESFLNDYLHEVGTLEIWAQSKESENRWRLQFELRKTASTVVSRPAAVVSEDALQRAETLIRETFGLTSYLIPDEGLWKRGKSRHAGLKRTAPCQ